MITSSASGSDHLAVMAKAVWFAIEPGISEVNEVFCASRAAEAAWMPGGSLLTVNGVGQAVLRTGTNAEIAIPDSLGTFGATLQKEGKMSTKRMSVILLKGKRRETYNAVLFIDTLDASEPKVASITGALEASGLTNFSIKVARSTVSGEIELGSAQRSCWLAILGRNLATNTSLTNLCVCFTTRKFGRRKVSEESINLKITISSVMLRTSSHKHKSTLWCDALESSGYHVSEPAC